jgi:hypothetical protein
MGNVTTGHLVQHTGLTNAVGFQTTLQLAMYQNNLTPWSASDLLKASLQKQTELAKKSPFRYISVRDGMAHFGRHCGGWVVQLNREKFVQLSLGLFASKGLTIPPDEAKLFYDIFDSIDLYRNATLSIGELAGGLSSFFGGMPEDRANAVYDIVASSGSLTKGVLQEFLKPYVWSMVPPNAATLRPILLPYVTERIFEEVTAGDSNGYITREQLKYWMFRESPMAYGSGMANPITQPVTGNAVAERAAAHVDMAINTAYAEYSARMGLREYGQQTWAQNHPGERQQLRDIGVARYVGGAAVESSIAQPTVWNNIGQQATFLVSGLQQSAAGLFGDLVSSRGRVGSTYSVDSSLVGTRTSVIGTLPISVQSPTARKVSDVADLPPPAAVPNLFQAPITTAHQASMSVSVPAPAFQSVGMSSLVAPQPARSMPSTYATPMVMYSR